ncbi:MAG: HNH endonuclease [Podoviridae sp. ctbj_2]|nr:MAG: HNH endonuclease [Podoviridae sp. ctbj_2]
MNKEIPGYSGRYLVYGDGRVKNQETGKYLSPGKRGKDKNYLYVILSNSKGKKSFSVHRLVAEAFIPNPENLPQVHHKDENTLNNIVDNLEWISNRDNAFFSFGKVYVFEDPEGNTVIIDDLPVFCKENNLCRSHMVSVHNGHRRSHLGWRKPKRK